MPGGVKRLRVDPASGMVLTEECWVTETRDEVFLASNVPAAGCPERPHRNFFDRTFGWFGDLFGDDQPARPERRPDRDRDQDQNQDRRRPRIRPADPSNPPPGWERGRSDRYERELERERERARERERRRERGRGRG